MKQFYHPGLLCGFLALALLGARHPLRAQSDTAGLRLILERRYAQQDSAIARRHLDAFLATLASNYRVELRDGQSFIRPAIDSAIARDMRLTRAVTAVATIVESVRVLGDTAWATVVHRADRVLLAFAVHNAEEATAASRMLTVMRSYLPLSAAVGVPLPNAYQVISWLCWVPNIILAEWLVRTTQAPIAAVAVKQPHAAGGAYT